MISLATFSEFQLNKNQMRNVVGGQEQPQTAICTTAGGWSESFMITSQAELFSSIDTYNETHSDAIVGCENPWAEE
jgi:hypothetical protein